MYDHKKHDGVDIPPIFVLILIAVIFVLCIAIPLSIGMRVETERTPEWLSGAEATRDGC